jgi:hypothetical protein
MSMSYKIDTTTILDEIAKILSTNKEVLDWCNSKFEKTPTIQIGYDPEASPSREMLPLVIVYGTGRKKGEEKVFEIDMGFAVQSKKVEPVSEENKGTVIKYEGFYLAEEFRELCENALRYGQIGGITIDGETESDCRFPIFESITTIQIKLPKSGRR